MCKVRKTRYFIVFKSLKWKEEVFLPIRLKVHSAPKAPNYFHKKLHFRYLAGFWTCLSSYCQMLQKSCRETPNTLRYNSKTPPQLFFGIFFTSLQTTSATFWAIAFETHIKFRVKTLNRKPRTFRREFYSFCLFLLN